MSYKDQSEKPTLDELIKRGKRQAADNLRREKDKRYYKKPSVVRHEKDCELRHKHEIDMIKAARKRRQY